MLQVLACKSYAQSDTCYSILEGLKAPEKVVLLKVTNDNEMLDSLLRFVNLEFLQLDNFLSQEAPSSVASVTWLRKLEISNSKFISLPKSYASLVNLEEVIFLNDPDLDLKESVSVLSNASNLKSLKIEGINLDKFPMQITQFTHLQNLSLRNDHLNSLPIELAVLKELRTLDLGQNDFDSIPKFLSEFPELQTLYLDNEARLTFNNSFRTLEAMPALRELHLEGNQIDETKFCAIKLNQMESLFMDKKASESNLNSTKLNLAPVNVPPDISQPLIIPISKKKK